MTTNKALVQGIIVHLNGDEVWNLRYTSDRSSIRHADPVKNKSLYWEYRDRVVDLWC